MLEIFELSYRVIPLLDTDFARMFTHAYSAYMALGRWHYVFGSEFKRAALRKRWAPVTAAETIIYKQAIKAFENVLLTTRLLCWDEKRFYLEQIFRVNGEIRAIAYLEGLLRGPEGHLNPVEVFQILGVEQKSPPMPESIRQWLTSRS